MSKPGYKHSEETKEKMRQAHKGVKFDEERRRKQAERNKARGQSEETKEKLRAINTGSKRSEETRRKMSEAAKKKKLSPEHKRKIGEALSKRVITEETREKLRQNALARGQGKAKPSEETRRKMSEAHKGKKMPDTPARQAAARYRAELFKGRSQTEESNLKRSLSQKGREFSEEHRENLSISGRGKHSGPNSPNYIDGRSRLQNPYPDEFNPYLKRKIRNRDNHTCQCCFKDASRKRGVIHHVDGHKSNCDETNLTLVCMSCHNKIHSSGGNNITDKVIEFRNLLKLENRPLRGQ